MTVLMISAAAIAASCDRGGSPEPGGIVVYGPSIVELMYEGGIGGRISGVDRYTEWPPEAADLPRTGGYLDPSPEALALLDPRLVLSVGRNPDTEAVCRILGCAYRTLSFDRLEDVMAAADYLETELGADLSAFRSRLRGVIDSTRTGWGGPGPSLVIVVWHEPGDGTMTVAGRETWLSDLCSEMGMSLLAPATGTYPMVSVEGVLSLAPDYIVHACPGMSGDSASLEASERAFWTDAGFDPARVRLAFDDFMLIPGSRLDRIAERLAALCTR